MSSRLVHGDQHEASFFSLCTRTFVFRRTSFSADYDVTHYRFLHFSHADQETFQIDIVVHYSMP